MAGSRFVRMSVMLLCGVAWSLMPTPAPASVSQDAPAAPDAMTAEVREDSVRFRSGDVELHGMLRLPADAGTGAEAGTGGGHSRGHSGGPVPAIVLLPGGGTQYLTMEPDYWAVRLAAAGFATLVYHKRGTGDSGGDWASAAFDDFIADAGAAMTMLRRDPRIDERIGVMGFSQGGRLAPVVAARFGADAAVSISGPQISVAETRLWALRNALRRGGVAEADVEYALSLWREFLEGLQSDGTPSAGLDARIGEAARRLPAQVLPPLSADYQPTPIFNSLSFDPADDLASLEVPWLAMYGEDDAVVPVALLEHRTGLYSPNNDAEYLARYIGPERTRLPFWTAEEWT